MSIVVRAFHFLGDAMLAFFFSLAKLLIIIIAPCTSRESPLRHFFFFSLPYLSPVWERPRELGTATVHPCIWRAARLGLDCVGLVNSARKKIVMQCLCL